MRFANFEGKRILSTPFKKRVTCPLCNTAVIAKCGTIKVWHWSHKNLKECDIGKEPESKWHLDWKAEFPEEWQEVIITKEFAKVMTDEYDEDGDIIYQNENWFKIPEEHLQKTRNSCETKLIKHRADIKTNTGLIVEFQNQTLSPEKIMERENFYDKMIWVLNGEIISKNMILREKNEYYTFRWKHPHQSWFNSKNPIYIDMGFNQNKIFVIKKIYPNIPCGGWGKIISKENFIRSVIDGNAGNQ